MDNFIDTTNIEGRFEFSEFVRAYGKYLDEQLEVFNAVQWYQVHLLCLAFTSASTFLCSLVTGEPRENFKVLGWPQLNWHTSQW